MQGCTQGGVAGSVLAWSVMVHPGLVRHGPSWPGPSWPRPRLQGPGQSLGSRVQVRASDPGSEPRIQDSEVRSQDSRTRRSDLRIPDFQILMSRDPALEVNFIDVRSRIESQAVLGGDMPWIYPIYRVYDPVYVLYTSRSVYRPVNTRILIEARFQ